MNDEKSRYNIFTKSFKANIPLAFTNGEIDHKLLVHGPSDFKTLASYDLNLEKIVTLGWE
jgi:YidC/Oxa1 family membrane protein insertase